MSQVDEILAKHFARALSVACFERLERCHSFEGVLHFDFGVVAVPEDGGDSGSTTAAAAGGRG